MTKDKASFFGLFVARHPKRGARYDLGGRTESGRRGAKTSQRPDSLLLSYASPTSLSCMVPDAIPRNPFSQRQAFPSDSAPVSRYSAASASASAASSAS